MVQRVLAQQVMDALHRLLDKTEALFAVADELRKRQTDKSFPFEERYRATILIEEANELAKDHLALINRLTRSMSSAGCRDLGW